MPLLKKEFYKPVKGPLANDEDWWRLVFDTDAKRLYVEHEWSYMDIGRGGKCDSGKSETEISEYLKQAGNPWPHQKELVRLISTVFES